MWNPIAALATWLKEKSRSKEDLAKKLEIEHKQMFMYLVDATNFYFNAVDKGKAGTALTNYLVRCSQLAAKWEIRQKELEKAGAGVFRPVFFSRATRAALNTKVAAMRAGINGLGVAPLVWALIVAGAWAVERITDHLTTTTQEQTQLMQDTADLAAKLGLSKEDTTALINKNLDQAKSGTNILPDLGGFGKLALFAVIGFVAYTQFNKQRK